MKIGFIGSSHYQKLSEVQRYVEYLQYLYRPFGNLDDEWEEPLIILTELKNFLDCVAVVQAAKSNFTVTQVVSKEELISSSSQIVFFWDGQCPECRAAINLALDMNKPIEVIIQEATNEKNE